MLSPHEKLQDSIKELQMHTQKSFVPQPNETNPNEENINEQPEIKSNPILNDNKVGRNDNCPCGSEKKYKKCCGKIG